MFDKILEALEMEKEVYFLPKREYFYDMDRGDIMKRLKISLDKGARIILGKDRCLYRDGCKYIVMTLIDPSLFFSDTGIKDENGEIFSEDEITEKNDGFIEGVSDEKTEKLLINLLEECYQTQE